MSHRRGFTLLEVLVALTVAALVVLVARAVFETLAVEAQIIPAAGAQEDRDANTERLLRRLIGQIEVGSGDSLEFVGLPTTAEFATWCASPRGWLERCRVQLSIVAARDGDALVLHSENGLTYDLDALRTPCRFLYLADPSLGGIWLDRWGRQFTAPRALGVVMSGDTLILPIGERG